MSTLFLVYSVEHAKDATLEAGSERAKQAQVRDPTRNMQMDAAKGLIIEDKTKN